jgi:hypothetical protein
VSGAVPGKQQVSHGNAVTAYTAASKVIMSYILSASTKKFLSVASQFKEFFAVAATFVVHTKVKLNNRQMFAPLRRPHMHAPSVDETRERTMREIAILRTKQTQKIHLRPQLLRQKKRE